MVGDSCKEPKNLCGESRVDKWKKGIMRGMNTEPKFSHKQANRILTK